MKPGKTPGYLKRPCKRYKGYLNHKNEKNKQTESEVGAVRQGVERWQSGTTRQHEDSPDFFPSDRGQLGGKIKDKSGVWSGNDEQESYRRYH